MLLWETEFFAVSMITGDIETFRGIFINANTLPDAQKSIRRMRMDFLQLTGNWFKNFEEVIKNDKFYKPIEKKEIDISSMSFDDFCEWLDNALTVDDLMEAKLIVKETCEDPTEYLKIIEIFIKQKNEKDN